MNQAPAQPPQLALADRSPKTQHIGRPPKPRPPLDAWRLLGPTPGGSGLEGELRRLTQLRLANPGLGEDEAARLMRRPSGVFIRAAEITTRLHAGDVVTAIDGVPATPESLDRARQGTRDVRLEVEPAAGSARRVRWP